MPGISELRFNLADVAMSLKVMRERCERTGDIWLVQEIDGCMEIIRKTRMLLKNKVDECQS